MRTLQEKYNSIQEGKFSKEQFLVEARMQQPQLITRFNGYDDAIQILKNRGMIVEVKKQDGKKVTDYPFIVYTDKQGKHHTEEQNYEDDRKAFLKTIPNTWDVYETRKEASAELQRRLKQDKKETVKEAEEKKYYHLIKGSKKHGENRQEYVEWFNNLKDAQYVQNRESNYDPENYYQIVITKSQEQPSLNKENVNEAINYDNLTKHSIEDLESLIDTKNKELKKLKSGTNPPPAVQGQIKKLGAEISKIEREVNSRKDKSKKETVNEAKQPKATKKGLADYRYKPTNEMDKYPYEQILRGIRVELETAGVLGTPTPEEYTKALAKVSKNLEKDSIFYTNQVAGVNPKVDLHDKMVTATAKNTVDTFNGMKKAALKEGFKKLIKKVLSENLQEGYQKGDKVSFTNTNSDKTYKGTVVQDLGNGKFTFTAEDGKTYGSDGLGSNWKISKEVAESNFEDPDLYDWDEERVERGFDEMESENYREAEEQNEDVYEMYGEERVDEDGDLFEGNKSLTKLLK